MWQQLVKGAEQQWFDSGEFYGTIDGHDLVSPIKVMGILFVERSFVGEHGESRVHGCYTSEKRENAYWETYHMLAGTIDRDGELSLHSFSEEGHQLSELTGSLVDLTRSIRLMGKNTQGATRIWRIQVVRHDALQAVMLEHEEAVEGAKRKASEFERDCEALRAQIAAFRADQEAKGNALPAIAVPTAGPEFEAAVAAEIAALEAEGESDAT